MNLCRFAVRSKDLESTWFILLTGPSGRSHCVAKVVPHVHTLVLLVAPVDPFALTGLSVQRDDIVTDLGAKMLSKRDRVFTGSADGFVDRGELFR